MSQKINLHFARVRDAVTKGSPSDLMRLKTVWGDLLACVQPIALGGSDVIYQWQLMVASDAIPEATQILIKAIDRDTSGQSSVLAVVFLNLCAKIGGVTVSRLDEADADATESFLNEISEIGPGLVRTWWRKFRHLAGRWFNEDSLLANISAFLSFCDTCSRHFRNRGRYRSFALEQALLADADLHDFVLFAAIFVNITKHTAPPILFAFTTAATTQPIPKQRLLDLPITRQQIRLKPFALSTRLQRVLEMDHEDVDQIKVFHMMIRLVLRFSEDDFFLRYLRQGDLAKGMTISFWSLFTTCTSQYDKEELSWGIFKMISVLSPDNRITEIGAYVGTLLSECDFLSVIQKVIVFSTTSFKGPAEPWKWVEKLLRCNLKALRPVLRRDFIGMLDYLRTVTTPQGQEFLRFWTELAIAAGVSEQELRDDLERRRKVAANGLTGCSWYKCPLYAEECALETFVCTGCRMAMYCGLGCQERDWKEGMHVTKCNTSVIHIPSTTSVYFESCTDMTLH
ncbi:hypothetical protein FRB93_008139 [Tulasnella sp. JGI-2019a]|nr:hypothetical protein FRB93_008139 [Tulasnella sp. JGI-2019a]